MSLPSMRLGPGLAPATGKPDDAAGRDQVGTCNIARQWRITRIPHSRTQSHCSTALSSPTDVRCSSRDPLRLFAGNQKQHSSLSVRRRLRHARSTHYLSRSHYFNLWATLVIILIVIQPISAVKVDFQNCLSDGYRNNDPPLLQWVPLYADATFDTQSEENNLQLRVWGNVAGSRNRVDLPPAGDPYWTDREQEEGKIVRIPEPDAPKLKATTLFRKVDVLTFEVFKDPVNFCDKGLTNGTCPLAPVFPEDDPEMPYGYPSISMNHPLNASYAFTSLTPTLLVIYGDSAATHIGCVSTTLTPELGSLSWLLTFLPLLILLCTGAAVILAAIWSPWGSTDVFHWSSNYGRDAHLLRLVTPGFGDCLQYIQFVVLTGSLSLNYPGFYQPMVSQASWSALIFNQSFVTQSDPWQSVVDGIYVTNGTYGLERLTQLVGIAQPQDIWAGMMIWLCVIVAAVFILIQIGFLAQWVFRAISSTSEEDLRAKNIPFSIGNVVRIVFNYFLLPLVALSMFQLVIAAHSEAFTVALAVVTIVLLIVFAAWLLWLIIGTEPKSFLFDDLPTVLRYGPLYNTYSDHAAAFALIPVLLTFIRGVTIGAVQASGITQVVLLAICEVIQILTIYAVRPFHPGTSMNLYHTIFASFRLMSIMLMVAFAPPLGVTDGPKGWIGYAILILHALVLVVGFFVNALQTIVEVIALMMGAGGDDERGLTRGGLSRIFGMRQLARRVTPREGGQSRASQLSSAAMLDVEEGTKTGYSMPSGRVRSESAGSLSGVLVSNRQRSASALDSPTGYHRHGDSVSSYMPGTPGEMSTFSFLTSPTAARNQLPGAPLEASDPYYRPPRRVRRETPTDSIQPHSQRESISGDPRRLSQGLAPPPPLDGAAEAGAEISRGATPLPAGSANPVSALPNQPDYSTREVDFYYGVRGPALNSDGPGRKLGTGPADPTGPVATASGWFRNMFGGKTKEKGKGFEVVRSARMPPAMMARNGAFGDETPPEGIPVAMGVLRNGPIDSDDDEPQPKPSPKHKPGDLLTDAGDPREPDDDESESPVAERLPRGSAPPNLVESSRAGQNLSDDSPDIPRKSSKRNSALVEDASSSSPGRSLKSRRGESMRLARLPFERTPSQRHPSAQSSTEFSIDLISHPSLRRDGEERPASFGMVSQHSISRVDPERDQSSFMGSAAEVVHERTADKRP